MTTQVPPLPEEPLDVGGWRIEPRRCRITQGTHEARLEPRVMQTLVCLARKPGGTLTREELMLAVWGHPHISEDALNRTISQLRKAFAHGAHPTVQIETVPRVGYRLVAETPEPVRSPAPTAIESTVSVPPPAPRPTRWLPAGALGTVALAGLIGALWWARPVRAPDMPPDHAIHIRPLTAQAGHELSPSFSPDGSQVVYAGQTAPGVDDYDLFVLPVGSETPLRITDGSGRDYTPAWSPDGSRIAFRRFQDNACAIYTVAPVGGPVRRVQECDPRIDSQMSWSPDGRELAFASAARGGPMQLALLNVDAGSVRLLEGPPDAGYIGDSEPAFAPSGTQIAFLRWRAPAVADLYVRELTSGTVRRLTQDNVMMYGAAWSPDGRALVFSSARGGDVGLWHIPAVGGEARRIPASGGRIESVAVNPRGGQMVYQDWIIRSTLWSVDLLHGGAPHAVTRSTRWDWHPRIAPGGQQLVFVSDRSGAAEVWVSQLDGAQARRLTSFNGPAMTRPSWSPDARTIAFDAAAQGNFDLYAVGLDGGAPRRLTDSAAEDRISRWSKDGKWVYFGSNRGGDWQVWKVAPASGEQLQVTRGGGFLAQESADGRWLYFSRRDERGLWRRPLAGEGAEEQVVAQTTHNDAFNWMVDGDRLLYVEWADNAPARLMELDFARIPVVARSLAELPEFAGWSGLTVLPDGKLLYSRTERNETDLILIDNADEFVPRLANLAALLLPPPGAKGALPSRAVLGP